MNCITQEISTNDGESLQNDTSNSNADVYTTVPSLHFLVNFGK